MDPRARPNLPAYLGCKQPLDGHGEGSRTFWDRVSLGRAGKSAPGRVPGHSEAVGRGAEAGRGAQGKEGGGGGDSALDLRDLAPAPVSGRAIASPSSTRLLSLALLLQLAYVGGCPINLIPTCNLALLGNFSQAPNC